MLGQSNFENQLVAMRVIKQILAKSKSFIIVPICNFKFSASCLNFMTGIKRMLSKESIKDASKFIFPVLNEGRYESEDPSEGKM